MNANILCLVRFDSGQNKLVQLLIPRNRAYKFHPLATRLPTSGSVDVLTTCSLFNAESLYCIYELLRYELKLLTRQQNLTTITGNQTLFESQRDHKSH